MLHYPSQPNDVTASGEASTHDQQNEEEQQEAVSGPKLSCTPHTDSGLLTLLHQDATGGLEVRNANGDWISAPYIPGSIVVNVGDLMAQMSGGRFVATFHRVRSSSNERFSVPFFCEPGVDAMVGEKGKEVRYEEFVLDKMGTWVEFQDPMEEAECMSAYSNMSTDSSVAAY
jgi:isopenicillin N synthase-like dioxygenase